MEERDVHFIHNLITVGFLSCILILIFMNVLHGNLV